MKSLCKDIGYVVLVLGAIGSVFLAKESGVDIEYSYSFDITYERNWLSTIVYFLIGLASTGIFATIFFALSTILEKLETLEYRIPATDTNSLTGMSDSLREQRMVDNGGWKCNQCGRINDNTTGSCACGASKY